MPTKKNLVHFISWSFPRTSRSSRKFAGFFQLFSNGPARSLRRKGPAQQWFPSILAAMETPKKRARPHTNLPTGGLKGKKIDMEPFLYGFPLKAYQIYPDINASKTLLKLYKYLESWHVHYKIWNIF